MTVWLSTLRRGISHHLLTEDGRTTRCGRYVGAPGPDYPQRGVLVDLAEAPDTSPCGQCYGTAERHAPRVVRSRDRGNS